MKRIILSLTLLFASASISALEPFSPSAEKRTIGETRVEQRIIGGSDVHRLDGCEEQGFHLAAEETSKDIYTFTTYCGPIPEGATTYTVIRDTGI